jgi:hypothetical protein
MEDVTHSNVRRYVVNLSNQAQPAVDVHRDSRSLDESRFFIAQNVSQP